LPNAQTKTNTQFLVDKQGNVVGRYAPTTTPASLAKDIEKALA
jgi:glutathione peroxidase